MSTMKNFHELLNSSSDAKDTYIEALASLTKVGQSQLSALVGAFDWQTWGAESVKPGTA